MNENLQRIRIMVANQAMAKMYDDTFSLFDRFGYDGAKDYLNTQLYFLDNIANRGVTTNGNANAEAVPF